MSNRIVAFLTLIVIFLLAGALAWWYFSQGVSQIVLHVSGPKQSSVVLQKGGSEMLQSTCTSDKECVIDRVPPFTYTLKVSADGYTSYTEDIDVKSNSIIERTIKLERNIYLSEFHTQDAGLKIARKGAIATIESASGKVVGEYGNAVYFFMKKAEDSYELQKITVGSGTSDGSGKTISTFTTVDEPGILCFNESDGLAGLSNGNDTFIFDAKTEKTSVFLGANPESSAGDGVAWRRIHNISRSRDTLVVSTDAWAVMIAANGNTVANPLYDDIIVLPSGELLGLVRSGSSAKKSLLSLPEDNKSYVFLEQQQAGRSVVLESETEIDHFGMEESKILAIDSDGAKFVIENITK